MSQPQSAAERLKELERRRSMLIDLSGAQRVRLRTGLHAAFQLRSIRHTVQHTLAACFIREAMRFLPFAPLRMPRRLLRLTIGAWFAYRTFTSLRASLQR